MLARDAAGSGHRSVIVTAVHTGAESLTGRSSGASRAAGDPRCTRRYDDVPVDRMLPTPEPEDLIALVRDIADSELAPRADAAEAAGEYPRDLVAMLGRSGLMGLPYDEGGGQPYEV